MSLPSDLKHYRAPRLLDAIADDPAAWLIVALICGLILDAVQR